MMASPCCLVRCREADFTLCCLCKTGRIDGKGLTPEHVRERRALNAQRDAVIGAAARGREAVRARDRAQRLVSVYLTFMGSGAVSGGRCTPTG